MSIVDTVMARLPSVQAKGSWGSEFVRLSLPDESLPQFINLSLIHI